eukprot:TRINITY_DN496_c0_g1_i1.p1 TRINITY_DN496_c0_g1~~TRINITY_DN496_c0_g1_i1.p1  ORF type:complete len:346 (-),score=52.31 TRINITY_DN496_c0_g1_i1:75-1112(-)
MGGAWIIGYKAWSALLAKYLAENGVLVVAADYRNFPQGDIEDMQEDVHRVLAWTYQNIATYGGDPNNISVLGQSAGSHISSLCVLRYISSIRNGSKAKWQPKYRLKNYISLSGPYDLPLQSIKFAEHGFHSVLFSLVMKGDLSAYSPSHWIRRNLLDANAKRECHVKREEEHEDDTSGGIPLIEKEILLPDERAEVEKELEVEKTWRENYLPYVEEDEYSSPFPSPPVVVRAATKEPHITVIHGMKDNCVSWHSAHEFVGLLDKAAISNSMHFDIDKTHTDYILEGLMEGSEHSILEPILRIVRNHPRDTHSEREDKAGEDTVWHHESVIVPKIFIRIARLINPF